MKTKLSFFFVIFLGCIANAQIPVTPDPEAEALRAVSKETDPFTKIQKLLEFERSFPSSKFLPDVYQSVLSLLHQRNDRIKIEEVGERALTLIPDNITILLIVSRNYGLQKKNLDRAVQYAQKAVDVADRQKGERRYQEDAKWNSYINAMSNVAKANLAWINSLIMIRASAG